MGDPISFGVELRRRRLAAGLSLTRLAAALHYSKGYLSKVETGLKSPHPDLARRCDAMLDARGVLAALAPAHASEPESGDAIADGEAWLMGLSDGAGWFRPVHRREALAAGAASAFGFGVNGRTASATLHDAAPTELFRELFAHMRRLGQVSSPALLLPMLIAQTHTLTQLAARAARTDDELLVLAARYAEYTGWMAQESGNDQSALWWTQRAVDMAEAGGDQNLADYALIRKALIMLYHDDATQTIQLASRVRRGSPPQIRFLAAQREAQGHALAGDYDSCMRSLDQARTLTSRARTRLTATPLALGSTNLLDPVAMVSGWCLYDLGCPLWGSFSRIGSLAWGLAVTAGSMAGC